MLGGSDRAIGNERRIGGEIEYIRALFNKSLKHARKVHKKINRQVESIIGLYSLIPSILVLLKKSSKLFWACCSKKFQRKGRLRERKRRIDSIFLSGEDGVKEIVRKRGIMSERVA